ncbi:MAG: glycosyltransferase family 4 protein [Xanthobacteraceae bacterium]|nr:glycosyltransferase family 4 protein [Xanthobacteraceae bacterium]
MSNLGLAIVVAATAAISAAMILALLPALTRHALAHPNGRSSHHRPTPQGGGIAVIAASLAVAAGAIAIAPGDPAFHLPSLWALFAATAFIAVVGMVDDIRTIEVAPRLLLQALAVAIMIASLPGELRVVPALPWWLERALLFVACLWFVNLTNFMDGIDWMTVAEFVPIAVGIALIGLLGALPMPGIVVALALCGGLIGFAPFNRPVARIFLGDVGSLPIGLVFAWLLVQVGGRGHFAAALLLPLYYLADATLTLLRRMRNREPVWQAHRTHFYQLAVIRGFSVSEAIARVFAVNVALVALAIGTVLWPGPWSAALALVAGCAAVGWLLATFARGKP